MQFPEEKNFSEDFVQEQIMCLAKDIVDLNDNIDGLIEWSNDFIEHYNNGIDNIDYNFKVLDKRDEEIICKHNNLVGEISNLNFHKILLWGAVLANALLTFLLIFHVL